MKYQFTFGSATTFAAVTALLLAGSAPLCAQETALPLPEAQIREATSRILKNADKANCKARQCTILVTDFAFSSGLTSRVGMQLADQFSKEFASQQNAIQLINRPDLRAYLDQQRIPGGFLKDQKAIRWLGKQLGGTAVLTGSIENKGSSLAVKIRLLSCDKEKAHTEDELILPSSGLMDGLSPVEGFHQKPPSVTKPVESTDFQGGEGGVTQPACKYCPNPEFTNVAREASFSGSVLLDVLVSAEGQAVQVTILRGAPFGMNEAATSAVLHWKFKPATLNGKPVPARVKVEVVLRML